MNEIPVNELKVQTHYTEPVYIDDGYIILTPDIPVTRDLIARLGEWGYKTIFTEGKVAENPQELPATEAAPGEIAQTLEEEEQQKRAETYFRSVIEFLDNAFVTYRAREEISIVRFADVVKEMIAELKANRRFMLSLEDSASNAQTYVVTHSVKTTILALALADYLKMPPFKQIDIGTAALLHEIGLLKIPESIYLSERQLSTDERKALLAHPVLGFKILRTASFPAAVCQAVLEQNERLDGSGYPRRITGEKISQYGRILAVASSYNASISKRPYRPGIDGHSGLVDLVRDAGKRYDEKVLAALVFTLSLYPIGTHIVMSNGALGMVAKPNPEDPKHPVVKLLVDENGNPYPNPPLVHTHEGDEVVIARSMNKEELSKIKNL
jgi:HD-GYP domain-containing protein (c-di-GMP phosphodiesterase class II)